MIVPISDLFAPSLFSDRSDTHVLVCTLRSSRFFIGRLEAKNLYLCY